MRNATLHGLLRDWIIEAGQALAADADGGAEIPFDVLESPGGDGRTPLYCYRPLTGRFIADRHELVLTLPAAAAARQALTRIDGLERYLEARGAADPGNAPARAEAAMRLLLARCYDEATDFAFPSRRFARAHEELEDAVYAGRRIAVVLAPVLGLDLESEQMLMGEGLRLVRGDCYPDAPPDAVAGSNPAPLLAVLERDESAGAGGTVTAARAAFRRLLSALRLWDTGAYALGPAAWGRLNGGPWRLVALGGSGRARGTAVLPVAEEDELRAFCSLVGRRAPRSGELSWALARYEMGCERLSPLETLTDHLLALRALLEPEGPASGRLAPRLAALCAQPLDRRALAERVARAVDLERGVMSGLARPDVPLDELTGEIAAHLRALLRDALCGHLDADLRGLADELLAEAAAAHPEPRAAGVPAGWTVSAS
ncbi:MAG TPA: hypothetical protein VGI54_12475 [Solirubrobacteraceae bacterium]